MSELSYMDKLLDGVEVEWEALGDVGKVRMCKRVLKHQTSSKGDVPFYKIGTFGKEPDAYITRELFEEYKTKYSYPQAGEILISASGTIGRTVIFDGQDSYFQDSNIVWIENNESEILNKYLYYFYQIVNWNVAEGGTIKRLYNDNLRKIKVPIPPLNIQAEIVRILDTFTELTAELTAELVARKQQYAYYREQLLTFEENEAEWKDLGEVGAIRMCKRVLKSQTSDRKDIPFYKIGTFGKEPNAYITRELFDEYKTKYSYPQIGEVLISASGTIGRTVIFDGRDAYFQDSNIVWIENNESKVLNKYLFYFYQVVNWNVAEGGTIKRLYNDNLRKIKIPIPPLAEQERIVTILDKFDALTTSLTEGLPREIELRQQQYEYYRDLLLSFPKPEVANHD